MNTVIKRASNGAMTIIEDVELIEVADGESVFSQATESAAVDVIDDWQSGQAYSVDDVVAYSGKLWRVIQAHTSLATWQPNIAYSLFAETWASGTIPIWKQPLGTHDAYRLGQEVYHTPTDRIWVSDVSGNAFEPNSVANTWTLRDDQEPLPPETDEWVVGVSYSVNDEATYQGTTYRCIQVHTSIVGWQPPNVPALWAVV